MGKICLSKLDLLGMTVRSDGSRLKSTRVLTKNQRPENSQEKNIEVQTNISGLWSGVRSTCQAYSAIPESSCWRPQLNATLCAALGFIKRIADLKKASCPRMERGVGSLKCHATEWCSLSKQLFIQPWISTVT